MIQDAKCNQSGAPSQEKAKLVYRRHFQAALVQAGASLIMWQFALAAYLMDIIAPRHFIGVSFAVLYLVLINPPTLWVLKHTQDQRRLSLFSTFINLLEILGYTAVIYFLGGIEGTYLTIIYAAMVAYVGAVSTRWHTFLIAGICIVAYTVMILLEGYGLIPWYKVIPDFHLNWSHRLARLFVVDGLLLVIAYITSHTAMRLRKTRDELRAAQSNLEQRVANRTAELSRINTELRLEVQERASAEKSLKVAHETFLTVLDSIDATIYVADLKTHQILFMNRRLKEICNSDAVGFKCWKFFHDALEPCPHCTMGQLLDEDDNPTGVHVWEAENPISHRWHINYDRAIRWVDGRWVFLQIATDITQLKTLEKERSEAEAKLHRAQKMEAIGSLVGGVAHDLNNILGSLVSYPELLLMQLPLDSPLRSPIDTIMKAGQRAADIVQDLLTMARRGVTVREVLNLNQTVSDYLHSPEFLALSAANPRVRVGSRLEADLLDIAGSPVHLAKTLMNLVLNAAEAMPDGGEVMIATENRCLETPIKGFEEVPPGDYAVLCVVDTGTGISPIDLRRIFEPFFTKKMMGRSGTGLGMTVVWGTVKDLAGFVDVNSIEGQGTRFELYFPVTRQARKRLDPPAGIDRFRGRERILVVDDSPEQRLVAATILEHMGYAVSVVPSGEAAIDWLRDHKADLMVLDMIMEGGMDGLETWHEILAQNPGQRAIIASGFSESLRMREVQKLGAGAYVKKPYTIEKLGAAVRDELDRASGTNTTAQQRQEGSGNPLHQTEPTGGQSSRR